MTRAIRVHGHGGPDVLAWEEVELPALAAGEARIRHTAIGLNYIDVYHRTGLYPNATPHGIGTEGAGIVEAIAPDVSEVKPGDRVAYAGGPPGSYAEQRNIPAHRLIKLPDAIDDRTAAAMMLKGMTAQYLLRRTYRVQPGDAVLVHAAAGGVGLILCQWAKYLDATVIGTVGSDAKADLARRNGCDQPIVYTRENFRERVAALTGGKGVAVAYDSIGRDTFMDSLACLRPLGTMALYGQSSGPVPPIDPGVLAPKSLFLTRPTLFVYTAQRADLLAISRDLIDVVAGGAVRIQVNQTYALKDAAQAHRDLEARKTTGSSLLLP